MELKDSGLLLNIKTGGWIGIGFAGFSLSDISNIPQASPPKADKTPQVRLSLRVDLGAVTHSYKQRQLGVMVAHIFNDKSSWIPGGRLF